MKKNASTSFSGKVAGKATACLCAATLVTGMMPLTSLATEGTQAPEAVEAASTIDVDLSEMNSDRFTDGVLIESDDLSLDTTPWSRTTDGFVNDKGEIIPRAKAKGIDVSQYQGDINWAKVQATDVTYAIIRVGWGSNDAKHDDQRWINNITECERLGIPYGVYIYSEATTLSEAEDEANHVLRLLKGHNPDYPVYIDLENQAYYYDASGVKVKVGPGKGDIKGDGVMLSGSELTDIANAFCNKVKAAGYDAGIYSAASWWENYLTDSSLDQWNRWVAQWGSECTYSGDYDMWQATNTGSVDGISKAVDLNFQVSSKYELPENAMYLIFEPNYYRAMNPEATAGCKTDEELARHFVRYGMSQGLVGSPVFDPYYYRGKYADVEQAYGDDMERYYYHFIQIGVNERRQGSSEFEPDCYIRNYADLREDFRFEFAAYYRHYTSVGKAQGRLANTYTKDAMTASQYERWLRGGVYDPEIAVTQGSLEEFTVDIWFDSSSVDNIKLVEVAAWPAGTEAAVADWTTAARLTDTTWQTTVKTKNHKDADGTWNIHVYVTDVSGKKSCVYTGDANISTKEVPVYRLYNPGTGEHLYTSDLNERNVLYAQHGWGYEGVIWNAPTYGTPVYRLYNPELSTHLFTTDANEINVLTTEYGWVMDNDGNPLFYSGCSVDIYRLYNEELGSMHLLTTNFEEYKALPTYGWKQEGANLLCSSVGKPYDETRYYPSPIE